MLYLLSTSLPFAIGIAASPIPVIAVVAVLSAKQGNALTFLMGWILGLIALAFIVFLIPGLDTPRNEPTVLSGWIRLAIGGILAVLAGYKWSKHGREDSEPSSINRRIDESSPSGIVGLGLVLTALNPKVIALTFAGAANIDAYSAGWIQQITALGLFIIISSLTVAGPIILRWWFPLRSESMLKILNGWLNRYNNIISASALAVFSILLAVNGMYIVF